MRRRRRIVGKAHGVDERVDAVIVDGVRRPEVVGASRSDVVVAAGDVSRATVVYVTAEAMVVVVVADAVEIFECGR